MRVAVSISYTFELKSRSYRNPLCDEVQNCAALGAIIEFKIEATILLSVFTTEIGLVLPGVYAGPRASDVLDGFLGMRYSSAWLNCGGVVNPLGSVKFSIIDWKRGNVIR